MKILLKAILSGVIVMLAGCTNDESLENPTLNEDSFSFVTRAIANAPDLNFEKDNLPDWLIVFIQHLKPDNMRNVAAFQAKWKGRNVYYVYDGFSSCFFCNTFKSDGEKILDDDLYELWKSELDWELIYLSKSKICNL